MGWTDRMRFQVEDDDGNSRYVTPMNADILISGDRQDSKFNWQYVINDPIILSGDDFDWLWTLENDGRPPATRCGGVAFRILETCGEDDEAVRYEYVINLNESNWDPDHCVVSCRLNPVDYFSCIYRNWEDEIDVLDEVATKNTVRGLIGYLETQTCGPYTELAQNETEIQDPETACLSDPSEGWALLQNYWVTPSIIGVYPGSPYTHDGESASVWVRERVDDSVSSPPGDGWIDIGGDSWVREPEVYYYEDRVYYFQVDPQDTAVKYHVKLGKVVGANATMQVDELDESSFELNPPTTPILANPILYSNGLLLDDVLEALLENSCPLTFSIKSNFFRIDPDVSFPVDEPYPTAEAGFDKLMIWQLSDIVRPEVSDDATDLKITLKSLLELLKKTFNVDWTIEDAGATFRIEHISYFINANGEDLTTSYPDQVTKRNAYSYDSVKIPKSETFKFAFETTPFFNGSPILYPNICASKDVKDENYTVQGVLTDFSFCHQNGEITSLKGMFWAAVIEDGGAYYFAREDDDAGNPRNNGHLSWTKLIPNYWPWDRPQTSGTVNGTSDVAFESTFRSKRQQAIPLLVDCAFLGSWDPTELMQSGIGWGEVDVFEISLARCELTVTLLHEPNT